MRKHAPNDFYVVSRASQGVRVDLVDPAGNKEWARVRSVASNEFKRRSALVALQAMRAVSLDPKERKMALRRIRAELVASLIADWSLPLKDEGEVVDLLLKNPRLRRGIERVAEDFHIHFGAKS